MMYMFLTKAQASAWFPKGVPDYVRIIPKLALRETDLQILHRKLEEYAEKLETNLNKNNQTSLHRILLH